MTVASIALLSTLIGTIVRAEPPTVFVYYWPPDYRRGRAGHIALHLRDNFGERYLSFWPEKSDAWFRNTVGYRGIWHETEGRDTHAEEGHYPRMIDMSALDEDAVKRFIDEEKAKPLKWGVLHGETCVSVASQALRAGGLGVAPCGATVPACLTALVAAYGRFLATHPRAMAQAAEAARPAVSLARANDGAATARAYVPPATAAPPVAAVAIEPARAYVEPAGAAQPKATAAPAPTNPAPMTRPGCPSGYRRDPDDGECYPREMYRAPGSGASPPGRSPQPTDFGPGEPLKSR